MEWAIRVVLALLALFIGYIGLSSTIAETLVRYDLPRAHRLAGNNGQITALLAQKRFVDHPTTEISELARLAVQQDPTVVPAITTLGFQAQLRKDPTLSRRLFAYAQKLSRRDFQTQVWAIEDSVARGDVPSALQHYDIALRTSKVAPDLLFPVLLDAISVPAVRAGLVARLAMKPAWGPSFMSYIAGSKPDPLAVANLLLDLKQRGLTPSSEAAATAINGLINAGSFDLAWRFYASLHPGVQQNSSRDPQFESVSTTPSAFDWVLPSDAAGNTSIQRGSRGGIFDFSVPPTIGGVLLTQTQILPPGRYHLSGHSGNIQQPSSSAPYWVMTCHGGRELGRIEMPNSDQAGGIFAGQFTIPRGCPVQVLVLMARASDELSGSVGQIDRVVLRPIR